MAQIKLAEYTFNNSVGDCLPTLTPNTITMTKEDSVNGTTTKRIIYIDNTTLPTRIYFGTDASLLTVDYLNINTNITSMEKMFSGCAKLTYVNTTNWNTTNVTNMYYAFGGTSINEINVTSFNTDKVTNMDYMFGNCSLLRFIDITNFTTRSDMSTGSMFANDNIKVIYDGNKWKSFMSMAITKEKVTPPEHIIAKYKYDTSITSSVIKPTITGITSSSIVTKEVSTGVDSINYVIIGYDGTEQPITNISFSNFESLLTIEYLNLDSNINEVASMFQNCTNLTHINTTDWDVSNVQSTYRMCYECRNLTSIDLSNLNFAKVQDMSYMFSWCTKLKTIGVNSFIAKPTDLGYLFHNCYALQSLNLSTLDTSLTVNMQSMFFTCSSLTSLNVSNFDTPAVTNVRYMFGYCTGLTSLDIKNFNTRLVTDYNGMFYRIKNADVYIGKNWTLDVSSYNDINFIRLVTYLYTLAKYTFDNSIADCLPTITGATTSQWGYSDIVDNTTTTRTIGTDEELTITNISFQSKTSLLTLDYLNFTNAITNTTRMFQGCSALTSINALNWDTSNVNNMSGMFLSCAKLTTLDLSSWKVDNVTNMGGMFQNCGALITLNLSNWNTSKVSNMNGMFLSCAKLTTLDLSNWKVDSVTDMTNMFNSCVSLTTLDLSHFNVESVSNMSNMFNSCTKLTTLNLSNWKVDNVNNMTRMFYDCRLLTTLDLSHFKVDGVTTMSGMFDGCKSLTTLNISTWNTSAVSNMSAMFQGCSSLTTLDLSSWNTSAVSNMNLMFSGCNALTMLDISNFDTSKVTAWGSFSANKLTNIGLVYASSSTINSIVTKWLGTSVARNIYYMDAELSELTTQTNITYVPYSQSVLSCSEEITLRSNGDVYDELDLLTGQVIQRIGEDNEILEEEIVRTVELDGEISFYENSYIHTSSNEITPEFEFQPTLTNCYVVSDLKPNTQYTVLFEGNPTLMSLGGTTIENPISKMMITSGEVDNILWFDASVSKIMILEGDLTNRNVEYFTGVKSSQKIQVQLRGEGSPVFGEGGRR